MLRIRFAIVVMLMFVHVVSGSPVFAQSVSEVLNSVSRNVKEFQDMLPDFVCNERITSTEFESGEVVKEKIVDSVFTGVQRSNVENRVRFAFNESREVVAIDGKAVRKGTAFPKLPYRFAGGFSSLLVTTFAPDNLQLHDYAIGDNYKSGSASAVLMRFATKPDQQNLRAQFQGTRLLAKDVGAAWIDLTSFHVLRLQRQSLNLPPSLIRSTATADYAPVTIGENQFWMPLTIRAEVTEKNSRTTLSYFAEYSDCRKFTADIKIVQ
jgi:hypothetical protein